MVKWYTALFCVVNSLFILSGAVMAGVGVVVVWGESPVLDLLGGQLTSPPLALIALGLLTALTAAIGLFTRSHWRMKRYVVALLLLVVLKVMMGLLASLYENSFQDGLLQKLTQDFNNYYQNTRAKQKVDDNQQTFQCCGVNKPSDWYNANGTRWLPRSCCLDPSNRVPLCGYKFYGDGCAITIGYYIQYWLHSIATSALGIALIEVLCMVFGLCLARRVSKDRLREEAEKCTDEDQQFVEIKISDSL